MLWPAGDIGPECRRHGLCAHHAIDACTSLHTPERSLERHDLMTDEKLSYAICRIERLGKADFTGVGQRLHTRRNIHGLSEIIEVFVQRDCNGGAAMGSDLEDDAGVAMLGIVSL